MYVRKAIENLLQHKDIKRSSHHELKLACEEALKALEAAAPQSNNNSPSGPDIGKALRLFGFYLDVDKTVSRIKALKCDSVSDQSVITTFTGGIYIFTVSCFNCVSDHAK